MLVYCLLHITGPLFVFFVPFWHMTGRKPSTPARCPHLPVRVFRKDCMQ